MRQLKQNREPRRIIGALRAIAGSDRATDGGKASPKRDISGFVARKPAPFKLARAMLSLCD